MQFKQLVEILDQVNYGSKVSSELVNLRVNTGVYQFHLLYKLALNVDKIIACGSFSDLHLIALANAPSINTRHIIFILHSTSKGDENKFRVLLTKFKHPNTHIIYRTYDTLSDLPNDYQMVVMEYSAQHHLLPQLIEKCLPSPVVVVDDWRTTFHQYSRLNLPYTYKREYCNYLPLSNPISPPIFDRDTWWNHACVMML
jgi:hypothetical protein